VKRPRRDAEFPVTMNDTDRREAARVHVQLEVEIAQDGRRERLPSLDVSPHGIFLRTAEPWPLHAVVDVTVPLPDGPLQARATVVRTRPTGALRLGEAPGMGLQFAPLPPPDRARWEAFCASLPPGAERRRFARRPARLRVEVRGADDLRAFWTRNLSAGGLLFETDAPFAPDEELDLVFTHAALRITLRGKVVRREDERRVAVAFAAPDLEAFRRLIGDESAR
jgi:hypothetical protein